MAGDSDISKRNEEELLSNYFLSTVSPHTFNSACNLDKAMTIAVLPVPTGVSDWRARVHRIYACGNACQMETNL